MTLFPSIQPVAENVETQLPVYREYDFDFETGKLLYSNGSPSIVTGLDAVLIWVRKAIRTPRFRHEVYSWNFGCELESLVGQVYSRELQKAEAIRYIRECLLVNPYITDVSITGIDILDGVFTAQGRISTVYGEEDINV